LLQTRAVLISDFNYFGSICIFSFFSLAEYE